MKKILLISNYVFHYREKVYNYFANRFIEEGYEFHVLSNQFQNAGYDFSFIAHTVQMSSQKFCSVIDEIEPSEVILFLHLKDRIELQLMWHCRRKNIPVIFWNKGVSDKDPNNPIKNLIYHYIHNYCDALITYTPELKSNFKKKNHRKLFVAYNTVDCTDLNKGAYDRNKIKEKYGIKESKVVLYVSRLKQSKKIGVLLDALKGEDDIAVVAMGGGITPEIQEKFDTFDNLYYVGEKYGAEGDEIWAIGDVFSIPVSVGLGINEAIYWGMPTVTMQGFQPPEIYYLKEGKTGYIVNGEKEYREKLLKILRDDSKLEYMKKECERVYEQEVSIDRMYQGFLDAIKFCESKRGSGNE